ncbi:MAG: ATP synthase subunit I [Acidiferrobacter sp.]
MLWWQAGMAVPVGIVAALLAPHHDALGSFFAALAGGLIAMVSTLVLAYTVGRTDGKRSAAQAQLWLYGGAAARFVFAIGFLGLGLTVFHLPPPPFLIAFGLGQLAFLAPGISSAL